MDALTREIPLPTVRDRLSRLEAQFLKPHRPAILLALAGMLLQSFLLLPIPLLQGWILDQLARPTNDPVTLAWMIGAALAVSVFCLLGRLVLAWRVAAIMSRVSLEVVRVLTDAMHRKFQRLPVAYFDRQQTGRVMARITGDVGSLLIFLNSGSLQLVSDLVLAVGITGTLFWLQWQLALVSLMAVPLYAVNHRLFAARIHELSRGVRSHLAAVYALLSERVSAVRVVRSFAQEEAEIQELDRRIDVHRALSAANLRTGAWQSAAAVVISSLGSVAVIAYGALLVTWERLSVGELMAFYTLIALLYNPIVRLTQFYGTAMATLVAVDRIGEVFDEPETVRDRPDARPVRQPRGELAYDDVSFAYRPDGPRVLDRVELRIEPGMTVGILGPSGSGKSTLLALAPRLYDVPDGWGAVRFDGADVRELRSADLRRAVALVPQQAMLFEGTIRSNLIYACPNVSAAAIRRVLEVADLAGLVEGFPLGLETPIGERGFSLSGGQRQRLALARALLADPAVLLLDDCTSALDAETEARIQVALATLLPGRTGVIVSHKVSSVRHADLIVVLDGGRVREQGGHDRLLAQGGTYAQTFEQQTRVLAV